MCVMVYLLFCGVGSVLSNNLLLQFICQSILKLANLSPVKRSSHSWRHPQCSRTCCISWTYRSPAYTPEVWRKLCGHVLQ